MALGTFSSPIQPLSAVLPGCEEAPGGQPKWGVQQVFSVPLVTKTAASTTYKVGCFVAPSDGWYIEDAFVSAIVVPSYTGAVTLALENYDKSATTAKNPDAASTEDLKALTLKQGKQIALSTTQDNRMMDEGDTINATVTVGATEATAGEGLVLTLVLRGPETYPQ
jgi:hypothetical protein